MPELPDIAILTDAFQAALAGRADRGLRGAADARRARHAGRAGSARRARSLQSVTRRGKFIVLQLDRDRIIVNAMLTGRLGLGSARLEGAGLDRLDRCASARAAAPPASDGGLDARRGVAARGRRCRVELRYRDPTRMGKIYLLPPGVTRPVAGWDELGPDADDPELDLATWRARIQRHRGELKNLLRDQSFVAGIGNGYSDEILWAAGLAPFRKRSTLAPEEVDRLYEATQGHPGLGHRRASAPRAAATSRSRCGTSCTSIARAVSLSPLRRRPSARSRPAGS